MVVISTLFSSIKVLFKRLINFLLFKRKKSQTNIPASPATEHSSDWHQAVMSQEHVWHTDYDEDK